MTRWSQPIDLDAALAALRAPSAAPSMLDRLRPILGRGGYSEREIATAERRLGRPFPDPVRRLYGCASAPGWKRLHGKEEPELGLYSLRDAFWIHPATCETHAWSSSVRACPELDDGWKNADYLALAGDDHFRYVAYCPNPPDRAPGAILFAIFDGEPSPIVHLADSLAAWLDRYVACGRREPAIWPGNDWRAPLRTQVEYFEDHVRLNPADPWGHERLERLKLAAKPPAIDEVHLFHAASKTMRPLSALTDVEELALDEDQARDLEPLRKLRQLRELRLEARRGQDLSALADLENLEELFLAGEDLDIAPLTALTKLKWLNIDRAHVRDLGPLADCAALEFLQVEGRGSADLATLRGPPSLKRLHISNKPLDDATCLTCLIGLESLSIYQSPLTDISPLTQLAKLRKLSICRAPLADISPIALLSDLEDVSFGETKVEDLRPLAGLPRLKKVWLDRTAVVDLSPLASLTALEDMHVWQTPVSDLAPLARCSEMRILHAPYSQVSDLRPLAALRRLEELYFNRTAVEDLTPLAGLRALKRLSLDRTAVTDIAPLFDLPALESLNLRVTRVPQAQLRELKRLHPRLDLSADA